MNQFENKAIEAATLALVDRAVADPAFHDLCRQEPARAFQEATGIGLPEGVTLHFVEFAPGEIIVPLPPFLEGPLSDQLTEMELEGVSGGTLLEIAGAACMFSNTACAVGLGVIAVVAVTAWAIDKYA